MKKAFSEIGRITRKGAFIFDDIHPLAIVSPKTNIKVNGVQRGFSSFKEGFTCTSTCLLSDYTKLKFVDAHWSIGFYSKLLKKNSFVIEEISEPRPYKLDPKKKPKNYRIPDIIIFKCIKLGGQ